jgi:phosphoglycerate kinase
VEEGKLKMAELLIEKCKLRGVTLHLPVDHVCAMYFSEDAETEVHDVVPEAQLGMDIGPKSIESFASIISKAASVFWNGPMGVFEWEKFSNGTRSIADSIAKCEGYTVVGGGDSAAAVHKFGRASDIDHVSTGGGASLAYLQGDVLPGLAAFYQKES